MVALKSLDQGRVRVSVYLPLPTLSPLSLSRELRAYKTEGSGRARELAGLSQARLHPRALAPHPVISPLGSLAGALRRHRSQLEGWQQEAVAQSAQKRRLWELADLAAARLRTMSPEEKAVVLDLLEIKVTLADERPPVRLRIEGSRLRRDRVCHEGRRRGVLRERVGRQGIEP